MIICKVHNILPKAYKCQINRAVPIVAGFFFSKTESIPSQTRGSRLEVKGDAQSKVEMASVAIETGRHSINRQVVLATIVIFHEQ